MSRLDFIQHVDCSRNKTAVIPLRPGLFGEPDRKPRREKRCGRQPLEDHETRQDLREREIKWDNWFECYFVSGFYGVVSLGTTSAAILQKCTRTVSRERSPIISDTSRTSIGDTSGLLFDVSLRVRDWICRRAMNIQKRARSFPLARSAFRRKLKQRSLAIQVLILNNWAVRYRRHSVDHSIDRASWMGNPSIFGG